MSPLRLWMDLINNWVILGIIFVIIVYAWFKKVRVYEKFVEGAKEGFDIGVMIIPYLVTIFCAIAIFKSSGAMDLLKDILSPLTSRINMNPDLVPLLLIRPMTGSGARGVMLTIFDMHGVDSATGFIASIMQGSTETTFYVLAVYCGAVAVRRTRHVLVASLIGGLVGQLAAVPLGNWFYYHVLAGTH